MNIARNTGRSNGPLGSHSAGRLDAAIEVRTAVRRPVRAPHRHLPDHLAAVLSGDLALEQHRNGQVRLCRR